MGLRRTNPSDRRSSLLDLTDDGLQLVVAAEATFTETLAELTAGALVAPQHWPPYRSFRSSAPFSNGIRSACPQADRHVHTVRSPTGHVISLCCEANPAD